MAFLPEVHTADPGLRPVARAIAGYTTVFTDALCDVEAEFARLWPGVADGAGGLGAALEGWRFACRSVVDELIGMLEAMGVDTEYYRSRWAAAGGSVAPRARVG